MYEKGSEGYVNVYLKWKADKVQSIRIQRKNTGKERNEVRFVDEGS